MRYRLFLISVVSMFSAGGVAADPPEPELYSARPRDELVDAALSVIQKDAFPALVTVDSEGRPRARTVELRPVVNELSFWVATLPTTRKVQQIRANPNVLLYFSVDGEGSYVSVMGSARLHTDLETKKRMTWRDESARAALFPDYPDDYLLIEILPEWIEVGGQGIEFHPDDWRPQAIVTHH